MISASPAPGCASAHIGAQCVVEQIGVLRDEGDATAQVVELELAQIAAVERDAAVRRVPEAQQQIGERGLART